MNLLLRKNRLIFVKDKEIDSFHGAGCSDKR